MRMNAYEIRLQILNTASSNVWQEWHNKACAAEKDAIASGDQSGSYLRNMKAPTPEEILVYAEKLYKFVSQE